ncbi:hypothetical protein SLEP1_g23636 [Rubroshorea leprosula]|uniref:Uncharacterized protein n=1 Tax=Rubroshorea leprosula TaxID=152421 RepID=A0AAV5JMI6_9ROSI|nr:hypothetical protein SLEP1_g23636 [Rubroshorea leprosula]
MPLALAYQLMDDNLDFTGILASSRNGSLSDIQHP